MIRHVHNFLKGMVKAMKKGLSEIIILYDDNILCKFEQKKLLSACKSMLKSLKTDDNEINVTFLKFCDEIEIVTLNRPVEKLTFKNIGSKRNGARALIDCASEAIINTGARYAQQPEEEHPENIIFLMTVSGQENASKRYTCQQLSDMLIHQTDVYKWEFFMLTDDVNNYKNIELNPENIVLFDSDDIISLKISAEKLIGMVAERLRK